MEMPPTAMSPGSIARRIEADAEPGLVVGERCVAEGRAAESGGHLGREAGDRWVGCLDGVAESVYGRVTRREAGGVDSGMVGRTRGRAAMPKPTELEKHANPEHERDRI